MRLAAEADAVGELDRVERRLLEGLPEAVDVDQDVAPLRLRDQVADLAAHRLDRSIAQSPSPIAENENRSSLGDISLARARLSAPRSAPYQGFARPPFTALRVVATSRVWSRPKREPSKRAPRPRGSRSRRAGGDAEAPSARNRARREATASVASRLITTSPWSFG